MRLTGLYAPEELRREGRLIVIWESQSWRNSMPRFQVQSQDASTHICHHTRPYNISCLCCDRRLVSFLDRSVNYVVFITLLIKMMCERPWEDSFSLLNVCGSDTADAILCFAEPTKSTTIYARGSYSVGAANIGKTHFSRLFREVSDLDFDWCANLGIIDSMAGRLWQLPSLNSLGSKRSLVVPDQRK